MYLEKILNLNNIEYIVKACNLSLKKREGFSDSLYIVLLEDFYIFSEVETESRNILSIIVNIFGFTQQSENSFKTKMAQWTKHVKLKPEDKATREEMYYILHKNIVNEYFHKLFFNEEG
jgi:hypothetical protein